MNLSTTFISEYTSTLHRVGVSATKPVHIGSWVANTGESKKDLFPGDKDYPGWHYGSTVSLYKQDKRPHDHAHYEICIIRQGIALHKTEFSTDELGPGTVVVMAPGMVHAIYNIEDLHQTNIYYLTEWLADDLMSHWNEAAFVPLFLAAALFPRVQVGSIPRFRLNADELRDIDHELTNITRESSQDQASRIFLRSCLLKILILMSRAAVRDPSVELSLKFHKEIVAGLEYIEGIILRRDVFRVSDLAKLLALSPANLATKFQKSTGWGPMAYYQHRRVQHACRFLLDLEKSITDVAYEFGFCDSAHFTHLFKKHQGILPS
ncbi:MAG: helix-turn-helix domain-containing protein, partial [Phycisphaeraceae bacterium]|nr:helix-turn-helix domain-containing protein [Phycisphaeraceae bacterium]